MTRLLTHRFEDRGDAARRLATLRQHQVIAKPFRPRSITTAGHDGPGSHPQTGARDEPFLDGALEGKVCIARALGAEIPQGGEARHEGGASMHRR